MQISYKNLEYQKAEFFMRIIYTIFFILIFFSDLSAEDISNRGKEFYFAFMPNYHNNKFATNQVLSNNDSLYIFISSDIACAGTLSYYDNRGNLLTQNIQINNPDDVFTIRLLYKDFELIGQNDSGTLLFPNSIDDLERPVRRSFHLEMEQDVTLVIHNQAQLTSDGCLVYPVNSLGNNYFVFSHNSSFNRTFNGISVDGSSTPSQFLIIATEDDTEIEIEPSSPTWRHRLEAHSINLNKGDVYLVQSDILGARSYPNNTEFDLTGTNLKSTKPIAVMGGHQRANIPHQLVTSRDILMSQMIPLEAWGRNVFIVPFIDPQNILNSESDITKITVAYDDTDIYLAGEYYTTLNKGEKLILPIDEPMFVEGDKPIRACIYKRSTNSVDGSSGTGDSDPFMVLFPPKEQFLRSYKFINVQAYQQFNFSNLPVYTEQYVNIIIPKGNVNSLRLDGAPITNANFREIQGSDYVYSSVRTSDGTHSITADTTFGICVFGYGRANSYGYVGGLGLEVLDYTPPQITSTEFTCTSNSFVFEEQFDHDDGIESVKISEDENINIILEDELPDKATVLVELINERLDGIGKLEVRDSSGSVTREYIEIPGKTIAILSQEAFALNNNYFTVEDSLRFIPDTCFEYTLVNYGKFPQTINNINNNGGPFTISENFPITLLPEEQMIINICYEADVNDSLYTDSFDIDSDCGSYPLINLIIYQRPDLLAPTFTLEENNCPTPFNLSITESTKFDLGIDKFSYTIDNIDLNILNQTKFQIDLSMSTVDPYQDGFYSFTVSDLAGNTDTFEGIIQGFTLNIDNTLVRDYDLLEIEESMIGSVKCQNINLFNYGSLEMTIPFIKLKEKLDFSIPPSQFPIIIPAKDSTQLQVCFNPSIVKQNIQDFLELEFNCISKDIEISSSSLELELSGESRCKSIIRLRSEEVPDDFFVESIYPNPSQGEFNTIIGMAESKEVFIRLIDNVGNIFIIHKGLLNLGYNQVNIDTSKLPTGYYSLITDIAGRQFLDKVLIKK